MLMSLAFSKASWAIMGKVWAQFVWAAYPHMFNLMILAYEVRGDLRCAHQGRMLRLRGILE